MRQNIWIVPILLAIAFMVALQAESQSTMTLNETTAWMKNYLDKHGSTLVQAQRREDNGTLAVSGRQTYCASIRESNECTLTIHLGCADDPPRYQGDGSLNLKAFDPSSAKATTFLDGKWSGNLGNAVEMQSSNATGIQKVPIDSSESAGHFAKALAHATELCGGKSAF
jgi:hypothetical protein